MILRKGVLQYVASVVIVAYLSFLGAGSVAASELPTSIDSWTLMAQVSINPATADKVSAEEERALREIYDRKLQRLEAELNNARGSRDTLLTVAVTSAFLGAGISAGSTTVSNAVKDIEVKNEQERQDKEDALKAIDALQGVGGGILAAGAVSLVAYLIYAGVITNKQNVIDALRQDLDSRFQTRGLTPEYLQRNESVAAVLEEMDLAKKSAGASRSLGGIFSRLAIGSLLSGGLLYVVSTAGQDVIKEVNIDENDPDEVAGRDDALDQAQNIETTSIILLGAGTACGVASFLFGRRAARKERLMQDLENSLLRVADRIDFQPKMNGFALMYSYTF
jgi:hypothetical protein